MNPNNQLQLPSGTITWNNGITGFSGNFFPSPVPATHDISKIYFLVTPVAKIVNIQQKQINCILVPTATRLKEDYEIWFCERYPLDINVPPLPTYSIGHIIKSIEQITISKHGLFSVTSGTMNFPKLGYLGIRELCKALELTGRRAWAGKLVTFS